MNCEEAMQLVDGYCDGELDALTNVAIEQHLSVCEDCQRAYAEHQQFLGSVERSAPYYGASRELRDRVRAVVRGDRPTPRNPAASSQPAVSALTATNWNWLKLAAAVLIGGLIGILGTSSLRTRSTDLLATELIASHARSLLANHLTDVVSADQHTVKPWLDNKLDFAPSVVDLRDQGFPLVGGRLDYISNRPVAALVYQRRQHFINVFVWPNQKQASTAQASLSRHGYHLMHWNMGDLDYWAVSDVNADDLRRFSENFQQVGGAR